MKVLLEIVTFKPDRFISVSHSPVSALRTEPVEWLQLYNSSLSRSWKYAEIDAVDSPLNVKYLISPKIFLLARTLRVPAVQLKREL